MPKATVVGDVAGRCDPALLESYARLMEESGLFRIVRRLPCQSPTPMFRAPGALLALCVDVETTGPDPATDEVIEVACVPFQYAASGRILAVHQPVCQLREPTTPIPAHVTRSTGLDAQAVRGRVVDEGALAQLVAEATIVVAHNAAWDRPFMERLVPAFAHLPWACSMSQIPWGEEGVSGQALPAIAASLGFFYEAHRAVDDCMAAIAVLARPLPRSGGLAMAKLLRNATAETCRVWALHSPYEAREQLRRRGYRWSNGDDGQPRCWFLDVGSDELHLELAFLRDQILGSDVDPPVTRLTAYERFSSRG